MNSVPSLRTVVKGDVLGPGSSAYQAARALWNGRIDRRPGAIVRCLDERDVVEVVRHARANDLPLSIRGGGHHTAGFAVCDDGVMIDLSMMNGVEIDPRARTARIGPGARARDVNAATQPFGLAMVAAPIGSCGMAGYALGGGLGWISRKYGLACDSLLSAEVVTADGRVVRASETENADLFWALRGGGGNFGVVTSFDFRLHDMGPDVLSGQIVYRMDGAAEALRFYRDYMPTAPDELACMPVVFRLPDVPEIPEANRRETVLAIVPFYDGDQETGMEIIRPLREVGSPLIDVVGPAPYAHLLDALEADMYGPGDRNAYETAFLDELSDEAIDAVVAHIAPVPSRCSSAFLEWLGGAISRVEPDATAYPHRARRMCLTAVPKWEDRAEDGEMIAWATRLFDAVRPHAAPGRYVNYVDVHAVGSAAGAASPGGLATGSAPPPDPDAVSRDVYGSNYERLARIKARWDPDNIFRQNHNIRPQG